jgi:uncharacterized phage protein (TIGR01671 family)
MRTIKFRGLRVDGKGWAVGDLVTAFDGLFISPLDYDYKHYNEYWPEGFVAVQYGTIGQFTGLTDKNGVEVFEGDNVRINGNEYFIRFNIGVFVAESVTANHLSLIAWEFNGTDVTVTGNIHEQ